MDFKSRAGSQNKPERSSKEEVQQKQGKIELYICFIGNDHIIQDDCKKDDGNPDKCDKQGLPEFTQTCLAVYFPVCSNQNIEDEPEKRDDHEPEVEIFIPENLAYMMESLVINRIFPVNEKQQPGQKCRNEI